MSKRDERKIACLQARAGVPPDHPRHFSIHKSRDSEYNADSYGKNDTINSARGKRCAKAIIDKKARIPSFQKLYRVSKNGTLVATKNRVEF